MISASSGKFIKCISGYQAFVPDVLPPQISWSLPLVNALSEADLMLGRLAGEGSKLPNPHILMRPFIAREAVLSSRIEGTQTTLEEILASDAGAAVKQSLEDLQEVKNYVLALEYGIERLQTLPLSLRLLCELHARLMQGARGQHATPGEFRRSQNWIGPAGSTLATALYVPPPPDQLMMCLDDLEKFLHARDLPALIQGALAHYQFEAIHPFLDGNGRIGRLLITLFLVERSVLPTPLLYLSAFFEATRQDYYTKLLAVSQQGKWEEWLIYFLNGVARQAEDALSRAQRINQLLVTWRLQTTGLAMRLLEQLASNPFITIKKAAVLLGVAFTTMQRAIDRLERLGIVTQLKANKRNRVYCAVAILKILEEPAKLTLE